MLDDADFNNRPNAQGQQQKGNQDVLGREQAIDDQHFKGVIDQEDQRRQKTDRLECRGIPGTLLEHLCE